MCRTFLPKFKSTVFLITVLEIYIKKVRLLKQLQNYGFSEERSELSTASIKLLAFIIHCQKKSTVKVRATVMNYTCKNLKLLSILK